MKHFWNAKVKKLVSIVLATALLVGLCPSILQTSAATTYSGRLHLNGAQTGSGANYMYLLGTDEGLCGDTPNEDWSVRLTPADDESGVYVNEARLTGGYELIKYYCDKNKVYNWYYLNGFDFTTAGDGKIEIKGNFTNNKNSDIVNLKPVTFTYDNGTWTEEQEADETFTIANISGSAGDIYLRGTSGMPAKDWTTSLTPCGGSISFLDKETQETKALTVDIRRPETGYYYFVLGEKNSGLSATTGDMVTIQGKFYLGDYCVDFAPTKMVRTEDTWSIVTEKDITFTGFAGGATGFSDGNWNIYLLPSSTLPGTNDSTHFTGLQMKVGEGEAFDITFNPTGYWNSAYFAVPADKMPENLADGTKITIQAGKADSNDGNIGVNLTSDFVFYAKNGGFTTEGPVTYQDVLFTGFAGNATGFSGDNWNIYLLPSVTLPGTNDNTHFTGLKMKVGDGEAFDITFNPTGYWNSAYFAVPSDKMPENLADGTKITIQAGKADSDDGSDGINLTSDFVFYAKNGNLTTTEPSTPVQYRDITFKTLNSASSYSDDLAGWVLYLNPSTELPGTDDMTAFSGLRMKVGSGEAFPISITKASHQGTAFLFVDAAKMPKEFSSNTKIQILAGQATSNDGNDGIRLTEAFTIYANQYGLSTEGYLSAQNLTDMQLKSINSATAYADGTGWFLYLNPSVAVPGIADSTHFAGLQMKIGSNEPFAIRVDKSGHQGTVFIAVPQDKLPKNIMSNTKIQILAGEATSNDGSDGIKLIETFTIYANQYGMSTKGFLAEPKNVNLSFKSINGATGYSDGNGWLFYLNPSVKLPGTADSTNFKGLQMTVGTVTTEVTVIKASHQDTAFFVIDSDLLPKDIGKNTKIVIHAGTATSNDGSDAIKLVSDFTIYANKYGMNTDGFYKAPEVLQDNAKLTLDRDTDFGGNSDGIYLNTSDKFPVDETWGSKIFSANWDQDSGVYLNDEKIEAPLFRFANGKVFVGLADAGVKAKDHDKLTIKGLFVLNNKGITYQEASYFFNGKTWNEKYEPPKPEVYTKFKVTEVNGVSGWNESGNRWDVYMDTSELLPGEGDKIYFKNLTVEVNGKPVEILMHHASFHDNLFFVIDANVLPKNVPDGTQIVLKAGRALAGDLSTGIELTENYTFYTWKGTLTSIKPTTNTAWKEVSATGLFQTARFNNDMKAWLVHVKLDEKLVTESGAYYLELPVNVNGKQHLLKVQQDGDFLSLTIPENILSGNANTATITIPKGATAYTNAGHDGIRFKNDFEFYLFNGVLSERKFTEIEDTEARILGVQTVMKGEGLYHVYLRLNTEFPGSPWYERYEDFVYYYNGRAVKGCALKPDSSNNKYMYFTINESEVGVPQEGDIVKIEGKTVMTCGGYRVLITDDFMLEYTDGLWTQYVETDVKAPKDVASLWEIAQFDRGYIPLGNHGSVLFSNEDEYNTITSTEPMKDYTISFNAKKQYDDEVTPSFGVILRGNAINDEEPMTKSLLYGYVITFSAFEQKTSEDSEEPGTWGGYFQLWKNGENYSLLDQYRVSYVCDPNDHPYFQYDRDYNYTFSIYNVTETTVCIEAKVNDKLVMRYYDEAGSDPMDPAINAGSFQVFAGCPTIITDDTVELSGVIAEKENCKVGEKVRVAVTYPSELEGAEFAVDKDGATVEDGMFVAEKPGTYTVSGSYNGKKLASTTITVKEEKTTSGGGSMLPIVIGGLAVLIAATVALLIFMKQHGRKTEGEHDSSKETNLPE